MRGSGEQSVECIDALAVRQSHVDQNRIGVVFLKAFERRCKLLDTIDSIRAVTRVGDCFLKTFAVAHIIGNNEDVIWHAEFLIVGASCACRLIREDRL